MWHAMLWPSLQWGRDVDLSLGWRHETLLQGTVWSGVNATGCKVMLRAEVEERGVYIVHVMLDSGAEVEGVVLVRPYGIPFNIIQVIMYITHNRGKRSGITYRAFVVFVLEPDSASLNMGYRLESSSVNSREVGATGEDGPRDKAADNMSWAM